MQIFLIRILPLSVITVRCLLLEQGVAVAALASAFGLRFLARVH